MRVLITGASGSGTTTLARAVAAKLGWEAIDADDFFWLPTDPPFREKRDRGARLALVLEALARAGNSVLSGSVMSWGPELEDSFDLVVFLYLETSIRIERLRARETAVLGRVDEEFLTWASEYDAGPASGRSLAKHESWLAARRARVLRLTGDGAVEKRTGRVVAAIARLAGERQSAADATDGRRG